MVNSFNNQVRWNVKLRMRVDLWVQFSVSNFIFTGSSSRLRTINVSRVVVMLCVIQTSNWRCKSRYVNSGVATITLLLYKIHLYVRHPSFFLIFISFLGHETQLENSNGGGTSQDTQLFFRTAALWCPNSPCGYVVVTDSFKEPVKRIGYKRKPYGLVNKIITR
jgi:hypothetical protein